MKSTHLMNAMFLLATALPASASVAISSPRNNSTVGPSVQVTANSSTSCPNGVATVGIYIDHSLTYVTNGNTVDKAITLTPGNHLVVVQEWDYCGGATNAPLNLTVATSAAVHVTAPAEGATVANPTAFVASATSNCPQGVAAMGVYVNDSLVYQSSGASLNAPIALGFGKQAAVIQAWDHCGGYSKTPVTVNVSGTTLYDLQAAPGWNQWGEPPPRYDICDAPCPGITWSMLPHQTDISTSGNATRFDLAGTTPYADALWSNPVIGQGNKQNLTDRDHTLLPKLHNFVLDTDVYVTNLAVTQDLEFDINWFGNGVGMEWGTECNHLDHGVWDIWDNLNAKWVPTSIPCVLKDGAWNHITLEVQRQPNNDLLYQSVTVNGVVHPLNITVPPFPVPIGWWGMTVNYQMDGDYKMHSNTTYLDKTNFTYW